ncbi:polyphosphate kinase 2 [Nitrospirillum sp. BR 11828]|uniref:polyphosphate kinase 2 n=1 Tax=Nitrospirillum sp. BR 11828 TaxID=3104325 RepID=UPI002ACAEFCA|nr:polyphosphate kinase 2 [Nitrospirillum sp. BR 11828]MDZ5649084.1 polyphosphate kinase 2 [Nitrospirillum sp. BR 11828]
MAGKSKKHANQNTQNGNGAAPGGEAGAETADSTPAETADATSAPALDGEILRNAKEHKRIEDRWNILGPGKPGRPPKHYKYIDEMARLQFELLKLQEWVRIQGLKVVVLFEGRDAAGKGGVIKRITESLNPRICRVVALATPTEREKGQWYFQRYVQHLPGQGEMVLFDRSWYNRAGVEKVMGFCTDDEYQEFLRACPLFEEMLVKSGIILIKYWFSVSDEEQEKRFVERMHNPMKRWKLSPMDLESRGRWVEYSKAKDVMLAHTDHAHAPWYIVDADNKKKARLNCIAHLLHQIPYKDLSPVDLPLPPRQPDNGYKRPKKSSQHWVDEGY